MPLISIVLHQTIQGTLCDLGGAIKIKINAAETFISGPSGL
jgi:hypothetical protein